MRHLPLAAGLHQIRKELNLTLKEVEDQSRRIAEARGKPQHIVTAGHLSHMENSNSVPGIHKLVSLAEIYEIPLTQLMRIYEIYGVEEFSRDRSMRKQLAGDGEFLPLRRSDK